VKLRKKDRVRLERIAAQVKRGIDYLLDDKTAIMRESSMSSTDVFTASYYVDKRYSMIHKQMGSEFVLALTGLQHLLQALEETT
jgi:transketolase N-terminal domain/subunit